MSLAEVKIGYVDMQSAIQMTSSGKEARNVLEAEFQKKQKAFKAREKEFKKKGESLNKRKPLLSRGVFEKESRKLQTEFYQFQQDVEKSSLAMQQRERELLNPIISALGDVLDQLAKEGKYTIIFEKSKQGIVWAQNQIDLTKNLVETFEAKNKKTKK